jgi:AcrR family transcriptional regulator
LPRSSTNRASLNKDGVVHAAAALVNAEGAEALTINRLAHELGVQPPSLYNHIAGLDELWRELALLNMKALSSRLIQAAVGRSGRVGMQALAQAYRAYVNEFPGLYQANLRSSGKRNKPDAELEKIEEGVVRTALVLVGSCGLEGEAAIHAVRALRSAVHGFSTLEVAGGFGLPLDLDESFRLLIEMIINGMVKDQWQGSI